MTDRRRSRQPGRRARRRRPAPAACRSDGCTCSAPRTRPGSGRAGRRGPRRRGAPRSPPLPGTERTAGPAAGASERQHHVGARVDVGGERVLVHDGLGARRGRRRCRGTWRRRAGSPAGRSSAGVTSMRRRRRMPCGGIGPGSSCQASGSSVTRQCRCLGPDLDRHVTHREHVGDDGAALLPARAHPGQGEQVPGRVGDGDRCDIGRLGAASCVASVELGRVAGHQRGAGHVVEQLVDGAPDESLLVGEALQLAAVTRARRCARRATRHRRSAGDTASSSMV